MWGILGAILGIVVVTLGVLAVIQAVEGEGEIVVGAVDSVVDFYGGSRRV